jgi:DNA repair photolyase
MEAVERDLASIPKKQIVYIGATIDPYQMLEKKIGSTRRLLALLAHSELPVVVLTKSPLILRDLDLLLDLNRQGLVLVQFTVLTVDETKARVIARGAPAVAERLRAAAELAAAGIPVHFHLSPVIPGLYEDGELYETVRAIAAHGGQCIYSNILGMRHHNRKVWLESAAKLPLRGAEKTWWAYRRAVDPCKNVCSPEAGLIYDEMSKLRGICRDNHADFICEFIPGLDVFDPARFEQGIFRFGLPAVYQMTRIFDAPAGRMRWASFSQTLKRQFQAVDDEYLGLVKHFWDNGQLFENTTIGSAVVNGERAYCRTDRLQLARDSVLAWD